MRTIAVHVQAALKQKNPLLQTASLPLSSEPDHVSLDAEHSAPIKYNTFTVQ